MTLTAYLSEPIPRGRALLGVALLVSGSTVVWAAHHTLLKQLNDIVEDQTQRLAIYKETTEFLLSRADPSTLHTLNSNLDYWRVVRGRPVDGTDPK